MHIWEKNKNEITLPQVLQMGGKRGGTLLNK